MAAATAAEMLLAGQWETIKTATTNVTSFLTPSSRDLLMVMPRMAARAGAFVTAGIPEAFENMFGGGITGRAIAEATAARAENITSTVITELSTNSSAALSLETGSASTSVIQALAFQQLRTFGGIFSYITSKWALGCFAAAIIFNRTSIYAAPRRPVTLDWQLRSALRIIPIILLLQLAGSLLRAIRCQTSPDYPSLRYAHLDVSARPEFLDFSGEGGIFYYLSSILLFWEPHGSSCSAVNMLPPPDNPKQVKGSLSLLWPAFLTFCFSQFIESLSNVVEGRPSATENGMSLFEHSLAFAEAEAMIGAQISFPISKSGSALSKLMNSKESTSSLLLPLKGYLLTRCNTTPEVLAMTLISCLNNLTSHILGVFGKQAKYRLVNTGFWAVCFMASFIWCFGTLSVQESLESGIFRFPTVCVVGFIPHLIILVGIFTCGCIYGLGILITALSLRTNGQRHLGLRERFRMANANMQAHVQLTGMRFRMSEDFYTALLKVGFTALTAASEAVFLNEGRRINVGHWTWLEEEKMNEILQTRGRNLSVVDEANVGGRALSSSYDDSGSLLSNSKWRSGYSIERNTKVLKERSATSVSGGGGLGATQRSSRYMLAINYQIKIFRLLSGWTMLVVLRTFALLGINWRPAWVQRMLPNDKAATELKSRPGPPESKELEFWLITDEGELMQPKDNNVDVAKEMRKRIESSDRLADGDIDSELDEQTYSWFKNGGWWGDVDTSGDFVPAEARQEDDMVSVLSSATDLDSGWDTESPTPTTSDPYPDRRPEFDPTQLARLLNPQTAQDRHEAKLLGVRLARDGPLTRSQFARLNSSVLTSTKYRSQDFRQSGPATEKLTAEEEAEVLESLIVRFRQTKIRSQRQESGAMSWNDRAEEDLGTGGPTAYDD
ncbi:MAG: hypothetical protein GOMPHAMPRED_007475 [Gomphillus americanus]|uniref:Uncharacterized protein n=1 Tax=Gomphillus americanus TaxID=1940652 RepID=A0A8H3ES12_9LECA|nr:MAG: hypothetical protein GOMPHAMPRED_007475 [Gomphillus americanus]